MKNRSLPMSALFALGFFPALLLMYAIFNPEGMSYFQNVLKPLWKLAAAGKLKISVHLNSVQAFVGVCLAIGVVFFTKQVIRFVGVAGLLLAIAFFGTFYWMLMEQKLLPSERVSAHLILLLVSVFLGVSVAWPVRSQSEASEPALPQETVSTPPQ
ncbi:MAG: hypothetical protein EP343_03525 [Deltaproteobacteria bacterium]|nr:MAG: hypothetical protein EP343_03525 [Deltaproteobacteria bacterium]